MKRKKVKMCLKGGPKTEKCLLLQKPLIAIRSLIYDIGDEYKPWTAKV